MKLSTIFVLKVARMLPVNSLPVRCFSFLPWPPHLLWLALVFLSKSKTRKDSLAESSRTHFETSTWPLQPSSSSQLSCTRWRTTWTCPRTCSSRGSRWVSTWSSWPPSSSSPALTWKPTQCEGFPSWIGFWGGRRQIASCHSQSQLQQFRLQREKMNCNSMMWRQRLVQALQ